MPTLSEQQISSLLAPYLPDPDSSLVAQLSIYLDLLLRWNARTNLTSIRSPDEVITRHFGESLFVARHLPVESQTLLDLGSGAGFPGIPIHLLRPEMHVTLAESQNKKAAFLREVTRTLGLTSQIWAARAETLPANRRFDVVAMRAVDNMDSAVDTATSLLAPGGTLAILTTLDLAPPSSTAVPIPGSVNGVLALSVPRGTSGS